MSSTPSFSDTQITRYEALAAADGHGFEVAPACLLVEPRRGGGIRLLAVGTPDQVRGHPAWAAARALSLPFSVLIPGLVNAHVHLDLTHIGPRAFEPDAGFVGWIETIRQGRHSDPVAIAASVRRGIELSLAGGTVVIGDIAGAPMGRPSLIPYRALAASPLMGVSFVEFFGIGNRLASSMERFDGLLRELGAEAPGGRGSGVRAGLQPHAPNTVDLSLYLRAAASGLPLSTHLAESPHEREFIATGTGPLRTMLDRLGIWDDSILRHIGRGLHPVHHLAPALAAAPFLLAHVNDCDDADIEILCEARASVAYCPRASAYFGAERTFGPHRYRDMLRAGVNVALGTDSIVNLPAEAADPNSGGISILHEMRFLYARDRTDPALLLRMATTNGAAALGLATTGFTFKAGLELAGLVSVEVTNGGTVSPLRAVLHSHHPTRLLA